MSMNERLFGWQIGNKKMSFGRIQTHNKLRRFRYTILFVLTKIFLNKWEQCLTGKYATVRG